jgi:hypothetical protein
VTATAVTSLSSIDVAATADVVLAPGDTITGQVTAIDGSPVANATVTLSSPAVGFQRWTVTDAGGNYTFAHVPVGTATVQATFTDTQPRSPLATVTLTVDGQTVTVNLSASGSGD